MRPAAAAAAAWQPRLAAARGSDTASAPRSRGRLLVTAAIKVRKGKQVLCNKTLKAKEGNESEVAALCQDIAEWSRGRMADRGSGVLAFQFSEDDFEKGTFHFFEIYASQNDMTAHNNHEQVKTFVVKIQDLLEGPLGMVLYEYNDGKIGPASMEGDVKGEGGLDDATGTNRFGGGASMKQTSAVVNLTNIKEDDDEEKGLWGMKGFKLPDIIKLPGLFGGGKDKDKK
ncbi:hypothetical protein D9Q98_001208 [Chlorella vulgaris]|uniref:ABM domain-containing protein n=1 Tax=Chlorella vulgaris TaxID=3077 RepID=A0A9D4Z3B2_CHLVU|nr:hypothetical protein D9Q98_001208 [Chlorella vulgaris]